MRTIFVALLLTVVSCSTSAQKAAAANLSYDDISYPNYRYGAKVASLHDVDFKNLKMFWFTGEKPDSGAKLHNGTFKHSLNFGYEEVNLDLVEFLGSLGGGQHAVIDLEWQDCGGSCTVVGRVQVFELQSGHPTVVQEIEYDRHAPGTGVHFDPESKVLTVTGRSDDDSPACCPKTLDVMRFDWMERDLFSAVWKRYRSKTLQLTFPPCGPSLLDYSLLESPQGKQTS